ncbi:hypothetical protein D5366_01090 [Neokomagataea tanensis]|uniref:Formate hydrogenlyase n=1 Tax=Neokomagataea tanensis TaxID=661191 RepID=A0A4Y6V603_9PROT|nr:MULTISPECIES: hypothetical protein [Neokomagataea]QDH24090.1 hypothetical protein D5366_01090 [Neokomagataea tanensis]
MIGHYAFAALVSFLQLAVFVFFSPVLSWCLRDAPQWLMGRAVAPLRWRGFWSGWGMMWGRRLSVLQAFTLIVALIASLSLPFLSADNLLSGLADPLVLGCLLLAGRLALTSEALWDGAQPAAVVLLRVEWRYAGLGLIILGATEALIALAAPGSDGLSGLCANLQVEPVPGLEGALACIAVALAVACPPLRPLPPGRGLERGASDVRFEVDMARHIAALLDSAWFLLLIDIGLPGLIGTFDGTFLSWCLAPAGLLARLSVGLVIVNLLRVIKQERVGRVAVLFIGMALLLALSGRAAT